MHVREIITESEKQIGSGFKEAVENWQEMWNPEQAAQIILASPEAKPFMRPPSAGKIYRAVKSLNKPSRSPVIPYAQNPQGAANFVYSLDTPGKWLIVEKDFNPGDFLLDFTAMIEHYGMVGGRDENEYEVWMKPTPYYATGAREEVVSTFKT
jgi:hypothetical protein